MLFYLIHNRERERERERLVTVAIMCLPCSDLHPSALVFEAWLCLLPFHFITSTSFICSCGVSGLCVCVRAQLFPVADILMACAEHVAFSSSGCGGP